MIISAQMDLLGSLQNPKLQYLHGSTPDRLDRRKKAFSLPIPKIAVATYLKDLVEKEGNGEFLGVIHNGIDLGEYFPAVPESSRDGVGTIYGSHPAKDPKTVIGVLQGLSKLRPDVQLRVFSGDRHPRGISRSIYLRQPTVDQARDIYSRSQVWIMASESEGFRCQSWRRWLADAPWWQRIAEDRRTRSWMGRTAFWSPSATLSKS